MTCGTGYEKKSGVADDYCMAAPCYKNDPACCEKQAVAEAAKTNCTDVTCETLKIKSIAAFVADTSKSDDDVDEDSSDEVKGYYCCKYADKFCGAHTSSINCDEGKRRGPDLSEGKTAANCCVDDVTCDKYVKASPEANFASFVAWLPAFLDAVRCSRTLLLKEKRKKRWARPVLGSAVCVHQT
jgi:hypothetical protein